MVKQNFEAELVNAFEEKQEAETTDSLESLVDTIDLTPLIVFERNETILAQLKIYTGKLLTLDYIKVGDVTKTRYSGKFAMSTSAATAIKKFDKTYQLKLGDFLLIQYLGLKPTKPEFEEEASHNQHSYIIQLLRNGAWQSSRDLSF
jgi:hypothetical protein